tara:strand:+ start:1100 stop:2218 length:1119 start_codon:yes stop_codon:yes gene_type:complete
MAHIFKFPNLDSNNKGIISFTHNEWEWFFQTPETQPTINELKKYFYLGFNAARYHGKVNYPDIIDFCFSSPSLIEIENGHTLNIPYLDRNFLPTIFKDNKIKNKFYDIITVSRAIKFKHVLDLVKALRVLFDREKYYNTLLVIPTPENEGDGRFEIELVDYIKNNFNYEEKKYINICKLSPELGFLGMSQNSISFLYNNSKVVYKGSEGEGTCRALHEGIVCGCTAVYFKHHKGAMIDYLNETNSVAFEKSFPHPNPKPWNTIQYDIEEIANCLSHAVDNHTKLKPNTDYLFDELCDLNIKDKLIPWFSKLYEKEGIKFDKKLINLDNVHNRLCGHYLDDIWKNPNPEEPTTAIKTMEQLSIFINYINENNK